ncbi:type I restriction endonuclease subunit S [Aliivibrio fischeri]|uniref:restriction endonuclease subunit S n=1 Tax=Aliivibrio fischeri TaxID=668 RepID=UPI0012D8D60D|nr:restriction endonuclease subunit S [Aliivibrio fischeri]MUK28873.1 type I restriction endonuclease subunit S [Aliivibrio fischeri]
MSSLPKGWVECELKQLISITSGKNLTQKKMIEGTTPVFGGNGITGWHNEGNVFKPTIVIGRVGFYCGSVYITPENAWITDNAFITSFSEDHIDREFIYWLLKFTDLRQNDSSSAQPVISGQKVYPIQVKLPPLAEQKRIVEKLDEVLAQVDTIKARLDGIPSLLKRFRQSVLASAVSGKLTEEWRISNEINLPVQKKLGDVITKIGQGWSPKCENTPAEDGDWGVIKTSSVQNISFLEYENKTLPQSLEARPEHELLAGDILTTRAGPRVRCGVTAYVSETRSHLMICDKVYRYRVKESDGFSKYLVYVLNSPFYLGEIEKMKTGISDSGMNLTQTKFKQLSLLWPFIEEQKEIVRLVDQYFAFADTIEAQVKKAQARVNNLTQSILAKAFRGELVPQDPNDEPADKLLERIAQARIEAEALAKAAKKAETARKKAEKAAAKG